MKNAHPGSGSIVVDALGECVRQSHNLRGILEHARGRGVRSIHVTRLFDAGRPGARVDVTYHGGHLGRSYFVCGSHAVNWANSQRKASPNRSWFAGCAVTISEVPAGGWDYENTEEIVK